MTRLCALHGATSSICEHKYGILGQPPAAPQVPRQRHACRCRQRCRCTVAAVERHEQHKTLAAIPPRRAHHAVQRAALLAGAGGVIVAVQLQAARCRGSSRHQRRQIASLRLRKQLVVG